MPALPPGFGTDLVKKKHFLMYIVKFGSCAIEKTAHGDNSVGVPSYRGRTQITSSCIANDNCQNSVHVISVYEARSTGFNVQSGSISVHVSVTGEDTKPLILVLTSYYPIRWSLNIPSGVVFDKVIVVRKMKLSIPTGAMLHVYLHYNTSFLPQHSL